MNTQRLQPNLPRLKYRPADERGLTQINWLKGWHSFSFGDYYDPKNMGFRTLRVINEDRVQPAQGFGTHPHRDMEIITYVISGQLEHRDSMGNGSVIQAGEVQLMRAGTGVLHSEFNPSSSEVVHLLQIWILPDQQGLPPAYQEWKPTEATSSQKMILLASPDGKDENLKIHQQARLYLGNLKMNESISYEGTPGNGLWIQMIEGQIQLEDHVLKAGDGLSVENISRVELMALNNSRFLLFDLA